MDHQAPGYYGTTKKHDIPIGHLDFHYINECTDVRELEKILRVLRNKDEGYYPELEHCCEDRLASLNPNSRSLRKETALYNKRDLELDERQALDDDLKSWSTDMKNMEENVTEVATETESMEAELPPIRSGSITLTAEGAKSSKATTTSSQKRAMPRTYKDWDKIDVDKELEKIDDDEQKVKERTFIANKEVINLPDTIDTTGMSEGEKLVKANREKDKGNEAFRSNDYKEAITYYSRSICLLPTPASYNNRALARLKCSKWQEAIADINIVLKMEPDNVKALLRRGTAYKGLKKFDQARLDLNIVLSKEPNNKKAQELLKEIEKEKQERKKKGNRMKIEDVEGDDDDANDELAKGDNVANNTSVKGANSGQTEEKGGKPVKENKDATLTEKPARRMKIQEVDSDENDDDEEEVSVDNVVVNGHASNKEKEKTTKLVNGDVGKVKNDGFKQNDGGAKHEEAKIEKANDKETKIVENNEKESVKTTDKEVENQKEDNDSNKVDKVDNSSDKMTESESSESEVEKEQTEPAEITRPVFYTTEFPAACAGPREDANTKFRSGQYGEASHLYTKVISQLENAKDQVVNLSLMYSNRAACYLKTGDLPAAVRDCTASLELIPHTVKPLIRRASAYEHLERYDKAYLDYRHVLLLDTRVDQAHLGTKRCQQMLHQRDGHRWREKLPTLRVFPTEIPEIVGLDGKSTSNVAFRYPSGNNSTASSPTSHSQSQSTSSNISQSQSSSTPNSQSEDRSQRSSSPVSQSQPSKPSNIQSDESKKEKPKATPQQEFDTMKSNGNELVKKGKFAEAIKYYNHCEDIMPGQAAIYTNRALCYIRTNRPEKAEDDCTKALKVEKDNVKALFRRAQARKMLKQYKKGIEDIMDLLKVDPKNTAAVKELDVLKNYWRQELEGMKKNIENLKTKKDDLKAETKHRKRMVIQEVDSEEDEESSGETTHKDKTPPAMSKATKPIQTDSKAKTPPPASTKESNASKSKSQQKQPRNRKDSKESKDDTKASTKQTKEATKDVKTNATDYIKAASQKSNKIKKTSSGLPTAPLTAPRLDKATPYEFLSAWNALKKSDTVKPYYDLLKQLKPADIKTVISNKLDGTMLSVITKCVDEHYVPNGERDESYAILKNLATVPRFSTISIMMSAKEKLHVQSALSQLEANKSDTYTVTDIQGLRKTYGV